MTTLPSQFVTQMLAGFPASNPMPEPLRRYCEWLEGQELVREGHRPGALYALTYPGQERGCVLITEPDPDLVTAWFGAGVPVPADRLIPFCRIGGDGSRAALWRDDAGAQHIVAMGSGSGSLLCGVMVSDPVDFLRLLAIGYEELCWQDQYELTPEEIFAEEYLADADDPCFEQEDFPDPPPVALREWVTQSFGVTIPNTASEILPEISGMDDDEADDPFLLWIKKVEG